MSQRVLLALCLFMPQVALAAGYYIPDVGVRALGRGGAFAARADDLTAAWYNPAGLADQPGTRLQLDLAFVKQSIFYQRTDASGDTAGFPPIGNGAPPRAIPFIGISSDFGLKSLVFAFSGFGAYGRFARFPEDGPQRFTLIEANVTEAFYQLSVGWRLAPWLSLGAAFRWVDMRVTNKQTISVFGTSDNEGNSDLRVDYRISDRFTPNAQVGLLFSPTSFFDLGVSFRPPTPVNASGSLFVNPDDIARLRETQPLLSNLGIQGDRISVEFSMPMMLRTGLRFKHRRFDVEADFVWERWNGFGQLQIKLDGVTYTLSSPTPSPLPTIIQDRGYGDGYSVRLGSDIEVLPGRLTARLGYFYELAAVPDRSLSVNLVDANKHGVGLGLTARFGWFSFSLAYSHVQLEERQILDSNSRQVNIAFIGLGIQDQAPIVGRGRYRSGWDNLVAGVSFDLDTIFGWTRRR